MNGVARMTRRLDSGFRQKFENFLSFQFLAKSAYKIKCVRQYSGKEKSLFRLQKTGSYKSKKKSGFFQRGKSMALVKNLKFFHAFIISKISLQDVFLTIF